MRQGEIGSIGSRRSPRMITEEKFAVSKARQAYLQLRQSGAVQRDLLPSPIALSWERCLSSGLNDKAVCCEPGRRDRLQTELDRHKQLIDHALPVMETLYEQIVDSHSMVVLTNADGLILHSLGDGEALGRAESVALMPGVEWSEQAKGTNAIGTALVEERALVVHGYQHYFSSNHALTCSASPICDPYGQTIGALDVTGDFRTFSPHTLALVKMSVRMLENQLFCRSFPDAMVLHFHSRPEYLGTMAEGVMAVSPDGKVLSSNRNACVQLGLTMRDVAGARFEELFRQSVRTVLDHTLLKASDLLVLTSQKGLLINARAVPGATMRAPLRVFTFPRAEESPAPSPARGGATGSDRPRSSTLDRLDTGDLQIHAVIQKVRRVLGKDIPVLIHGETGAGKELLARAIHDDGPRFDKPFIAVNCAAIPEGLIESELFGYEEGAFTGAKRKGSVGRILQADGGTLFLDEIGDMPLALQARLLRVLQERVVNPLGATKSVPVDVNLVCATHRRLKDLVANGRFREDLYYRINGLTVNLPPLRARKDLEALVQLISTRIVPPGAPIPQISSEVMDLFVRHPWPGNIRQLSNLLRTSLVMAGEDEVISIDHLPDDFLEEFEAMQAVSPLNYIEERTSEPVGASYVVRPGGVRQAKADAETSPLLSPSVGAHDLESTTLSLIQRTLEQHAGNVSAAARQLGISRNTLYRKLRQIWQL
jgi:sigma-54 dependent transcriptional regulator, acetoin dehydrogenase operon transcriptional activator AcoR